MHTNQLSDNIGEDADLLKELVEIFAEHYPAQLQLLQEAIERCDCNSISETAHQIKGSITLFGSSVSEIAKEIEDSARNNRVDELEQQFAELSEGMKGLHQELLAITG